MHTDEMHSGALHIINLNIECKDVTGDGTRIVCMNSDYLVRINASDCGTFQNAPVKKLIVRHNKECIESTIETVTEDGQTYLQAKLPPIEQKDYVDLGVCGRVDDDPTREPLYASKSARFACDKSILCGTAILKSEPKLVALYATENDKTYRATENSADGFYEVEVKVPTKFEEQRAVELWMADGNQVITPSYSNYIMKEITVLKPLALVPENIKKGVVIGGVTGSYEKALTDTEIYVDGEYTPPEGYAGFSKVTVKVGKSSIEKTMKLGDSFTFDYDASASVVFDVTGIVKYENDGNALIFTAVDMGSCVIEITDFDADNKMLRKVYYYITVDVDENFATPVEASSVEEMQEYLDTGIAGGIIKYTGETKDGFVHNALYIIEEDK